MSLGERIMRLEQVSLNYSLRSLPGRARQFHALKNINLELVRGETLGVMGRNGCGKSSLLRILAGVIEPSSGYVWKKQSLSRALLSLGLGFNRELSGRDNALLAAMLQGWSKRDALKLLPRIKEYSQLDEFFEQPVKTYSSGMRSKLGFASAIIIDVDVLLVDETLSVGDSQFRDKAENSMLERIRGEQTVVFVSHHAEQVRRVCKRSIWLEGGEIRGEGESAAIAKEYAEFMRAEAMDRNASRVVAVAQDASRLALEASVIQRNQVIEREQ